MRRNVGPLSWLYPNICVQVLLLNYQNNIKTKKSLPETVVTMKTFKRQSNTAAASLRDTIVSTLTLFSGNNSDRERK